MELTIPVTRPSLTIGMRWMRSVHMVRHSSSTEVFSSAEIAGLVMIVLTVRGLRSSPAEREAKPLLKSSEMSRDSLTFSSAPIRP